jgi:thioredoxin reductase (NADPH)
VIETDALVIGAGPVGLFAVFELGLQGVATQVVDVLEEPGGQCIALYPDKPIYDIPGVPVCTGRELVGRLLEQVTPFKPAFHLGQQVSHLEHQTDGRWVVATTRQQRPSQQFLTRTVIIAAGVGAFVPKELKVDGLAGILGHQVFYRSAPPAACAGKNVVIVGGEDDAVANALTLATAGPNQASRVTLLHRRDLLQASEVQLTQLTTLREAGHIHFMAGQISAVQTTDGVLTSVVINTPDDQNLTLPLDTLLICLGISPKLGPVVQWGLAMERKQLCVSLDTFATSSPGIFAVGDVITYPGKKKLIVSGFHEATLAAFAAAALIYPDASSVLQYTTSSALLQQRLGVLPTVNA